MGCAMTPGPVYGGSRRWPLWSSHRRRTSLWSGSRPASATRPPPSQTSQTPSCAAPPCAVSRCFNRDKRGVPDPHCRPASAPSPRPPAPCRPSPAGLLACPLPAHLRRLLTPRPCSCRPYGESLLKLQANTPWIIPTEAVGQHTTALQLPSLWRIPAAAVGEHGMENPCCSCRLTRHGRVRRAGRLVSTWARRY